MENLSIDGIMQSVARFFDDHPITTDSITGWILLFLILFAGWHLCRKAFEFIGWTCGVILLIQVFYFFGQTGLGQAVPIGEIFSHDVLSAIAGTCEGTPFGEALLSVNGAIRHIVYGTWELFCKGMRW